MVVFSMGVLMVLGLTRALSVQMNNAALRSIVTLSVQNRLDSLEAQPFDSLNAETTAETITLMGESYTRTHIILESSAMVREIQVTVEPVDGSGPDLTASGFVVRTWEPG
jgi:hypothetical protein